MIDNWRINANQIPLPPAMPPGPAIIQHHLPQHPQNEYIDERQLEERIAQLRKQISDSEYNLKAQESALNAAKQVLSFCDVSTLYYRLKSRHADIITTTYKIIFHRQKLKPNGN